MGALPARHFVFDVSLDYYDFCLADADTPPESITTAIWDSHDVWTPWLALAPSLIAVRSEHPSKARVILTLVDDDPGEVGPEWDLVVDASLTIPSGRLAIDDFFAFVPTALNTIAVLPGSYRVRVRHRYQPVLGDQYAVVEHAPGTVEPFVISLWRALPNRPTVHRVPGP